MMRAVLSFAKSAAHKAALTLLPKSILTKCKAMRAFAFFKRRMLSEGGTLSNLHYQYFFTAYFDLPVSYYDRKRVIDIGCGPRGSLEWATNAEERVGLDPLVNQYRALGIDKHSMDYVNAPSEQIPFADEYFDVVSVFNSLDHVDDLAATIREIKRIVKPRGIVLLITEINHAPTLTEPQRFSEDILRAFGPELEVEKSNIVKIRPDHDIYQSLRDAATYIDRGGQKPAILTAMLRKTSEVSSLGA